MDITQQIMRDLGVSRCSISALAERVKGGEQAITITLRRLEREGVVTQAPLGETGIIVWSLAPVAPANPAE